MKIPLEKKRMNPHVTGLQNPIAEAQSSARGWPESHQSRAAQPGGGAEKGAVTSLLDSVQGGTDWLQKS